MCDCIVIQNNKLGWHSRRLPLVFHHDGSPATVLIATQPLYGGTSEEYDGYLHAKFCPFCGESYKNMSESQ